MSPFLSAALAGVVPALTASRLDLVDCLRAGGRGTTGAASARGRRLLVAAQVALAVTVVAAAGLLARSVQRLQSVDMGLAADRLVLAEFDLPRERYADTTLRRTFHDEVVARVGAAPGIESVTPLNVQPFAGATGWDVPRFTAEGQTADQVALNPSLNFEAVYPPYFSTLGVVIVRGREFTAADRDGAPRVAIVSDALAAATWPGQDPIGKRLKFGGLDSRQRVADRGRRGGHDAIPRARHASADAVCPGRAVHDFGGAGWRSVPLPRRRSWPALLATPSGRPTRLCG